MSYFDRIDSGLFEWLLEKHIPSPYYIFCAQVNKRWNAVIATVRQRTRQPTQLMALRIIIQHKRVELLKSLWHHQELPIRLWTKMVIQSAYHGDIEFLKWCYVHPTSDVAWIAENDANILARTVGRAGNIACLEWLIQEFPTYTQYGALLLCVVAGAAGGDQLPIIRWIKRNYPPNGSREYGLQCAEALYHGHWDCYEWCYNNDMCAKNDAERKSAVYQASYHGDPSIIDKVLQLSMYNNVDVGQYFNESLFRYALLSGKARMIKYCESRGCILAPQILKTIMLNTPLECVKYVCEHCNCQITDDNLLGRFKLDGMLDVVEYLYTRAPHLFTPELIIGIGIMSSAVQRWLVEHKLVPP